MADNFHFDMCGVALTQALDIAFQGAPGKKAVGWAVIPANPETRSHEAIWGASKGKSRLVLFWSADPNMTALPAPMDSVGVVPFVEAWLASAAYGPQPDHDGDNSKGWRVYNEDWGYVAGSHYAFVAIEPVWMLHGK